MFIEIINEVRKTEELEKTLFMQLKVILQKGAKFVKFCDETILKVKEDKSKYYAHGESKNRYRYGYSTEALIKILEYLGVEVIESEECDDGTFMEFSCVPEFFSEEKKWNKVIYYTSGNSQAVRTNLAILIYKNLELLNNEVIYYNEVKVDNIYHVDMTVIAFIAPMLFCKEGYLAEFYLYVEDLKKIKERSCKGSAARIFNLMNICWIDIETLKVIDVLYSKVLLEEDEEFKAAWNFISNI